MLTELDLMKMSMDELEKLRCMLSKTLRTRSEWEDSLKNPPILKEIYRQQPEADVEERELHGGDLVEWVVKIANEYENGNLLDVESDADIEIASRILVKEAKMHGLEISKKEIRWVLEWLRSYSS